MKRIIGIGNDYRRDDAVGLLVARALKTRAPAGCEVLEASGEGAQLMELWKDAEAVILIDALQSGHSPGAVRRFAAHREALPARSFRYSTHAFSLGEAIELARALGEIPPRLEVFGIEGRDFSAGEGLSPEVAAAARALAEEIFAIMREP